MPDVQEVSREQIECPCLLSRRLMVLVFSQRHEKLVLADRIWGTSTDRVAEFMRRTGISHAATAPVL